MGKSTVAKMFVEEGIALFDTDATVHALYEDPEVVEYLNDDYPSVAVNGKVDRTKLREYVINDPDAMHDLEQYTGRMVVDSLHRFKNAGFFEEGLQLFDVPLLYEMDLAKHMDAVVVVDAPPEVQKARVMARPGMTEETFQWLLAKQMPNAEKVERATFVIDISKSLEETRAKVRAIISEMVDFVPRRFRVPVAKF